MEQVAEFISVTHAAQRLGMSPANVRRLANIGRLPCKRLSNGERVFEIVDIDAEKNRRAADAEREQ